MEMTERPKVGEEQIRLLEKLCNACAVSGAEGEVRAIVKEELHEIVIQAGGSLRVDALGNVLISRPGSTANKLRVLVAAHMDEVGLMVTSQDGEGLFRFETVGGLSWIQLVGKPVWVGKDHLPGVIGAAPPHLTSQADRKNPISIESMRIDMGPGNGAKVKPGDRAVFATPFSHLGSSIRGKALDNRLGVATLIELVKNPPPQIDLLAAFTVQEEVGLRGAGVAAFALDPHAALVIDCTPANDLPSWDGTENDRYNTHLGAGPAIYIADRGTLSDPRLVSHLAETAERFAIPYQFRQPGGGGTDAGAIHKQRMGTPSISLSIPGRYLHTAASITRLTDWENTLALAHAVLSRLSPEILSQNR
jgi:tetrahedral aminopeptidase